MFFQNYLNKIIIFEKRGGNFQNNSVKYIYVDYQYVQNAQRRKTTVSGFKSRKEEYSE